MKLFSRGAQRPPANAISGATPTVPGDPALGLNELVADLGVGVQQLREEWPSPHLFDLRGGTPQRYRVLRDQGDLHAVQAQLTVLHRLHAPQGPPLAGPARDAAALKLLEAGTPRAWSQAVAEIRQSEAFAGAGRGRASDAIRALVTLASAGLESNPESALRDDAEAGFGAQRLDMFRCGLARTLFLIQVKLPGDTVGKDTLTQLVAREKRNGVQVYTGDPAAAYREAREQLQAFVQTLESVVARFPSPPSH